MSAGAALGLAAVIAGLTGARAQTQPVPKAAPLLSESVAAIVDDEAITTYALKQRMQWLVMTTGIQPTAENQAELQREALYALIDERLKIQELKRQERQRKLKPGDLFADDADVNEMIKDYASQNNMNPQQFVAMLQSRGIAEKTMRDQVKTDLSYRRWINGFYRNRIRISDDKVDAMMRELADAASKPSYLISEIFIDAARAGSVDAAVTAGTQMIGLLQQNARFDNLARQYSSLPSAASGGDAGWLSTAELEPEVAKVLETLRPGQVAPPIRTSDGAYLIMLREKRAGGTGSAIVNLRQIAVNLPADATPQQVQAAQNQLANAKSRFSGCPTLQAAAQGVRGAEVSDLGEADIKDLAPAFKEAVDKLQANQISDPVRTAVGMHLIAVCTRTPTGAGVLSRDEVEDRLYGREIAMIQRREIRNLRNAATITQPQAR